MAINGVLKNQVLSRLGELRENTIIVEEIDSFDLGQIKEGVITVWVNWSPGFISCMQAIKYLYSLNYSSNIYVIDIDDFSTTEKNPYLFGKIVHGWGEIFLVKDGVIRNEFLGKESFPKFKTFFDSTILK